MGKLWNADREARRTRKREPGPKRGGVSAHIDEDGTRTELSREVLTAPEQVEARLFVAQLARDYAASIEWYKAEHGGGMSHAEAVARQADMQEWRRENIAHKAPKEVTWSDLSAVADVSVDEALKVWAGICDAADDALASGLRGCGVIGASTPYARAEFLAIRDAFADEWHPRGGIEAALVEMLATAFSLQMYWATIAHERATHDHDEQRKDIHRFESRGWKSPYQSHADAVQQAHQLADGYNRQFLRVLRQMRDLRRYAPPVIVNHGGQVNVANQQVNVNEV